MAYGIWCQPVGPGPASPASLFIDSNLTFPQYLGAYSISPSWSARNASFNVGSFDGQGELLIVPTSRLIQDYYVGTDLMPSFSYVTGIGTSGQTVNINIEPAGASGNNNRNFPMSFQAYKLWPRGNRSYGITFSNSADFFSISDSGVVGQCVWAYRGSVGDGFTVPNAGPNALVFANWNQGGVCASYNASNGQMIITHNRSNQSGSNRGAVINDMRIAVFASGVGVPEHNGGLNIYSPGTTTCVFSTYRTPFAISRFFPSSGGDTGLGIPMMCMNVTNGAITAQGGGWMWVHERSHTMSGTSVGTGFGPLVANWTDQYPINVNINLGFNYPMLEGSLIYA